MTRALPLALLFAALTFGMAFPFSMHAGSRLLVDAPDTHLFLWTLAWEAHALVTQPLSIFDGNFYHPSTNVLAWSENLLGSGLVAAPIVWLTGNVVLALNVISLLACVLSGLGTYLLARYLGASPYGATISGVIFAFSPALFFRMSQVHLITVQWMPFCLAFLHAYLDGHRARDLRFALLFFSAQVLTSGHGAVFLSAAIAGLLAYRFGLGEPIALTRRVRDVGVVGGLTFGPVVWVLLRYREAQTAIERTRPLEPGAWFPAFESFFASPSHVHVALQQAVFGRNMNEAADSYLFPGVLPIVLALAALLPRPDSTPANADWRTRLRTSAVVFHALIAAIALWIFLRPPFGLWPHIYWLPGLSLIRMPSRFVILTLLALAVLAGIGFDRAFARLRSTQWLAATVCVALLLLAEFSAHPFEGTSYRVDIPAIDRWLDTQPKPFVVAELPVPRKLNYGAFERFQTAALLHSTAHWQKTVMGYSSIRPLEHEQLYNQLNTFPDEASVESLRRFGVTHIVVHTELYADEDKDWNAIEPRFRHFGLELIHADGPGRVYRFPPSP